MHSSLARLLLLAGALVLGAAAASADTPVRSSSPRILTRPLVNDGSIASRAPFLASRPFDDARRPDGQAIDILPPNTASTTPEPLPPPAPRFAIFQSRPSVAPGTSPTGRVVSGLTAPLDALRLTAALRATPVEARQEVISDLENRVRASETALAVMRGTQRDMSAQGREQFQAASADLRAAEKPLRRSIRAARTAEGPEWEAVRGRLEADLNSFADVAARIDSAAGLTPPARLFPPADLILSSSGPRVPGGFSFPRREPLLKSRPPC